GTMKANADNGIRTYVWGVREGIAGIAPFWGLDYKVPQSSKDLINRAINAFKAGTFQMIVNNTSGELTYVGTF
ncbi:MAG TPA: hypothetical protein VJ574_08380, partial [Candidatus Bathyarchaeia archaeon]|nr:hypothetical protein [Candidatus Bathyarchaeia archaeon]